MNNDYEIEEQIIDDINNNCFDDLQEIKSEPLTKKQQETLMNGLFSMLPNFRKVNENDLKLEEWLKLKVTEESEKAYINKIEEMQQEIERLTDESTHYEDKYYNEAKKVDTAIELLKEHYYEFISKGILKDKLLNILKGSDK